MSKNIKYKKKYVLVTGCAGFIGFHFSKFLLKKKYEVIGVDMMNHYYDINLKKNRLKLLKRNNFKFYQINIEKKSDLKKIFQKYKIYVVVNLAAQAGVRDAIKKPKKYLGYNILGFLNIIQLSTEFNVSHLVYASTSSVYGLNKNIPFREKDKTEQQNQFYAVTKKTNELTAHVWSENYNLPTTGLRFFTVYGPWGRPDMALFKFTKNIFEEKKIDLHNHGDHKRDFTYIDDIIMGIYKAMINIPTSKIPAQIFNLGNGKMVSLKHFISLIEKYSGKKALYNSLPLQKGDIKSTKANISKAKKYLKYSPKTSVELGIKKFVKWYKAYY